MKKKFYAYYVNKEKGIVNNWEECKKIIGNKNAKYKSFFTDSEARYWLDNDFKLKELSKGIYFDAGTGGKIGVEVRVTDEKGKNILQKIIPLDKINKNGNYSSIESTNNFGELLGCYFALKIALIEGIKNIYGDSKLILEYWSKGRIKKKECEKTMNLVKKVKELRKNFEDQKGRIEYISGSRNPADLGYHK